MNYYDNIKELLINNEITKKVKNYSINKSDLSTYYNVGKELSEAGKHYGEGIIREYSKRLTNEIGKGYSKRSLELMRKFYNFQKTQTVSAQLTWSHYCEILAIDDINVSSYYIRLVEQQKLSVRQLRNKIKSNEYERLPLETKNKLINKEEVTIKDLVPDPIIIKNKNKIEIVSEKVLHKLIMEDIESFMKELGDGFCFVGSEYKIKIGNTYNSIDLLLFNVQYNAYVVVELKITKFKAEYISQVQKYMNYIDKNIKTIIHNNTIGMIICKKENRYVMEYCSDSRIMIREFMII